MARVTIEDCLEVIPNRFELALIASQRAKELASGAQSTLSDKKKEKPTVIALREIADGLVDITILEENIIKSLAGDSNMDSSNESEADNAIIEEDMRMNAMEVSEDELGSNINIQSDEMIFAGDNLEVDD